MRSKSERRISESVAPPFADECPKARGMYGSVMVVDEGKSVGMPLRKPANPV